MKHLNHRGNRKPHIPWHLTPVPALWSPYVAELTTRYFDSIFKMLHDSGSMNLANFGRTLG